MQNRERERILFYRRFLFGLLLVGIAGAATLWHFTSIWIMLGYLAGFTTPLVYARIAPTYDPQQNPEDTRSNVVETPDQDPREEESDAEEAERHNRGFN